MRKLLVVAFTLFVAVVSFISGARWGPGLVSRPPWQLWEDESWLCSAPPGRTFQVGEIPDRAQIGIRVRSNARSAPVAHETFLAALRDTQWRLIVRVAEDSSLPRQGGDGAESAMPPRAVSRFLEGMKCERLAEPIADPDVDLVMLGDADGYETTLTIDGEESRSKVSWAR